MDNTVQWSLYDIDLGFSGEHFFVWIYLGALYVIDLGVNVENCFFCLKQYYLFRIQ